MALGPLDTVETAFIRAAIDPSYWNEAMDVGARAVSAFGSALFAIGGRLPNSPHSASLIPSFESYVRDGWISRDERDRAWPAFSRRGVGTDLDFCSPEQMARHPYYQEFLAPHGLRWWAGVRMASGDTELCWALQRTVGQGPFVDDEVRALAGLSRRLSGPFALAQALGFGRADAALASFQASGTAVALLDRFAEVLGINEAARALLGRDLQISHKRLTSADRDATVALDRALQALLWAPGATVSMPPVVLPRMDRRPLLAHPMRLPGLCVDMLAPCQAVVVIIDLEAHPRPSQAALRRSFGLTPAEARLAAQVASGQAPAVAADALGVSYETVRNQLKAIFAKTDTHRQAELVALLAQFLNETP
ncbi:helix-turn-helix transcriptional regulator [Chelatococcus reniformis]|uniref:Transcriptional regulator n=1 Tax=Chelatococcus reniformis TaxID=1494448 RepID=A0A916XBQ0_9HYPH|nr:helix-turn-helix transcriptional regulator [Chelatococcus reniformis]GGC59998.1 transcriptional regulator [Chelatococcus reniformis]